MKKRKARDAFRMRVVAWMCASAVVLIAVAVPASGVVPAIRIGQSTDIRHPVVLGMHAPPHARVASEELQARDNERDYPNRRAVRTRWALQEYRIALTDRALRSDQNDSLSEVELSDGAVISAPSYQTDYGDSAQERAPAEASAGQAAESPAPNIAQMEGLDPAGALAMSQIFANEVPRRLIVPAADQARYGAKLQHALDERALGKLANEYVVLVDRSPNVQALFIYFRATPNDVWQMIGATPVSTGRPGTYDHFVTPPGVFEHTPHNMDFRAEGTVNEFGIRGYGSRGMRIYDFGWALGERGWGKGGTSQMRLQMHATDPDKLEPVLGILHSKGCVRIPAALNEFLDERGILDAEYEALADAGQSLWVLTPRRAPTSWAGRYLVVIDSERKTRPAWSPLPDVKARAKAPVRTDTAD
ncbi:hypothetical protein SAMN05414139_02361 [Burkholderia sp. D7]|nr:hypothetical protein SAMN05414139_02361 [Burkholderia sp. D7]